MTKFNTFRIDGLTGYKTPMHHRNCKYTPRQVVKPDIAKG